jgi:EAL domain-containing protein (putative c-di-GMP-specific phosphodiesterase class I)
MIHPVEIAEGLARGEFYLEYLPILSLPDLHCIGAEALIRWRRADGVVVMPGEFIPCLECTPASGVLTYWVIETAAAELREWLRRHPDVHLSLNIPPEIAGRGGVYYAAMKSGLADMIPQLILEVTERGLPDTLGLEGLLQAQQLGIKIALDDVNLLGGANLAILSRCPFDIIKVDRHLLAMITPETPNPEWLEGLTALIRASRLMVIAEGIETAQQLQALMQAGVQAAQGFHLSPPLAAAGLIAFHGRTHGKEDADSGLGP